jgi:hypothetical protein
MTINCPHYHSHILKTLHSQKCSIFCFCFAENILFRIELEENNEFQVSAQHNYLCIYLNKNKTYVVLFDWKLQHFVFF